MPAAARNAGFASMRARDQSSSVQEYKGTMVWWRCGGIVLFRRRAAERARAQQHQHMRIAPGPNVRS
jgi:hypothetical protein